MPLASASSWARAKSSATRDETALAPNAVAPAHIAARICTGVAFAEKAAMPTSSAATGLPRSTVCRSARADGARAGDGRVPLALGPPDPRVQPGNDPPLARGHHRVHTHQLARFDEDLLA